MKLMHLSDLHLGMRIREYSMAEDQEYILGEITGIAERQRPDGIIIAGDVYDKSVASAEAMELFESFIYKLADMDMHVFVVSGNHDSPERLSHMSRFLDPRGIHIAPAYNGRVEPFTLKDRYGPVNIFLLPFVKPAHVRRFYPDEAIESYNDALGTAVKHMDIDTESRNVLVTHQFVTGAARSDSETAVSVGGADSVDAAVFAPFDYVALGHLHSPQSIGEDRINYCGTPLKYSFSEAGQTKSVSIAELGEKGDLSLSRIQLGALHDMREIRGAYDEVISRRFYEGTPTDDYLHIILTDEEDIPEAAAKLRTVYKNLMKLSYDNSRTRASSLIDGAEPYERRTPIDFLGELYRVQNGQDMSEKQRAYAEKIFDKLSEVSE